MCVTCARSARSRSELLLLRGLCKDFLATPRDAVDIAVSASRTVASEGCTGRKLNFRLTKSTEYNRHCVGLFNYDLHLLSLICLVYIEHPA